MPTLEIPLTASGRVRLAKDLWISLDLCTGSCLSCFVGRNRRVRTHAIRKDETESGPSELDCDFIPQHAINRFCGYPKTDRTSVFWLQSSMDHWRLAEFGPIDPVHDRF